MSIEREGEEEFRSGELAVADLLRRARPLPPFEVTQISDLSDEEEAAFLAALDE